MCGNQKAGLTLMIAILWQAVNTTGLTVIKRSDLEDIESQTGEAGESKKDTVVRDGAFGGQMEGDGPNLLHKHCSTSGTAHRQPENVLINDDQTFDPKTSIPIVDLDMDDEPMPGQRNKEKSGENDNNKASRAKIAEKSLEFFHVRYFDENNFFKRVGCTDFENIKEFARDLKTANHCKPVIERVLSKTFVNGGKNYRRLAILGKGEDEITAQLIDTERHKQEQNDANVSEGRRAVVSKDPKHFDSKTNTVKMSVAEIGDSEHFEKEKLHNPLGFAGNQPSRSCEEPVTSAASDRRLAEPPIVIDCCDSSEDEEDEDIRFIGTQNRENAESAIPKSAVRSHDLEITNNPINTANENNKITEEHVRNAIGTDEQERSGNNAHVGKRLRKTRHLSATKNESDAIEPEVIDLSSENEEIKEQGTSKTTPRQDQSSTVLDYAKSDNKNSADSDFDGFKLQNVISRDIRPKLVYSEYDKNILQATEQHDEEGEEPVDLTICDRVNSAKHKKESHQLKNVAENTAIAAKRKNIDAIIEELHAKKGKTAEAFPHQNSKFIANDLSDYEQTAQKQLSMKNNLLR